jgi:hypothetical protein
MGKEMAPWKIILAACLALWMIFGIFSAVQSIPNCDDPRNSYLSECAPEMPSPSGPCAGITDEDAFSNCMESGQQDFGYVTP